jgi:hypothetical protein
MNAESPPETERGDLGDRLAKPKNVTDEVTVSCGDVNAEVALFSPELSRIRERLLEFACTDPERCAALIRPAAQIDKAVRLLQEFLEPQARREFWWNR